MMDDSRLNAGIATFAHYGFRKTSMENVAAAMGISRQALYKRYRSKEALFQDLIKKMVCTTRDQAVAAVADTSQPLHRRLLTAFDICAGQHVDLMRASPHSMEVIDFAAGTMREVSQEAEEAILSAIVKALGRRSKHHRDIAYTLLMASKGLMMKAQSRADYKAGMARVIAVALPS